MALPRLDYQQPDYLGQIGEGVGAAAKVAQSLTPAHPLVQKYLRAHLNDGMDPREAAIMAKLEAGGHLGGDQAPQGQQLTGGNVTFSGPSPQAPMGKVNAPKAPSPTPASQPVSGGFTGPREYSDTETVTAPRQPDLSALSPQPQAPEDNTPILNRDVPTLMQAASGAQKHNSMDTYMKLYALGLRGDELAEKYREFEGMQPVRQSMINQRDAGISNMPFKNKIQEGNLNARWAGVDVARGNLATRQNEGYLKETADTAWTVPALDNILSTAQTNPGVTPDEFDYGTRKAASVAKAIPLVGKAIGASMEGIADTALTDQQRQFRSQVALAMARFQHLMVGSQITEGEQALIDRLAGQQLSIRDTVAALHALRMSMAAKQTRAKAAFPEAAGRIPDTTPQQALPKIPQAYPTDTGGVENLNQPGPEGPSLDDELNANPLRNR